MNWLASSFLSLQFFVFGFGPLLINHLNFYQAMWHHFAHYTISSTHQYICILKAFPLIILSSEYLVVAFFECLSRPTDLIFAPPSDQSFPGRNLKYFNNWINCFSHMSHEDEPRRNMLDPCEQIARNNLHS